MADDLEALRPYPEKTPLTAPFWDGLRERRIRVQYSPSSQAYVFYPRSLAPRTLADDLEWRDISGAGTLYSFTVAVRPVAPWLAAEGPRILAVVEWDEGPRFTTELTNVDPADVVIGMRVRPVFCDVSGRDVTMLRYEPMERGSHD